MTSIKSILWVKLRINDGTCDATKVTMLSYEKKKQSLAPLDLRQRS